VRRIHYRFGYVLALILATLAVSLAAPQGDLGHFTIVLLQAATLVAAVIASRAHRWVVALSVAAAVLGIGGALVALIGTNEFDEGGAVIVALPYVLLTPLAIISGLVKHFREEGGVTMQTMFGVLCLYLLIGLMFGVAFGLIDDATDGGFFEQGSVERQRDDFLYFSFSTLTTTGYGDLTAGTDLGRSLSITEALIGQIYLVTVVAVIVGNLRPAPRRRAG
jgi:hypothetical protein